MIARLLAAEWVKLRSIRSPWWLLVAALLLTALSSAVGIAVSNAVTSLSDAFVLDTPRGIRAVLSAANAGSTLALVIGILGVTGEYRHGTMTQTLVTTPDRRRVMAGKLATYALVGLGVGVLDCAVTLAVAVPWLRSLHLLVPVLTPDAGLVLAAVLLSTVLYCLMGVALGALVKNQVAAVLIGLAWLLVVQAALAGLVHGALRWTTGGAAEALLRSAPASLQILPPWGAALVLLGYAVALAVAGTAAVLLRDAR
ncbi:MAG: hypothetical protein ACRDYD_12050 [Acidimicrobiales bacterium]